MFTSTKIFQLHSSYEGGKTGVKTFRIEDKKRKKEVDFAHQNYMNSEKYRVDLIDSYLQNLNLKGNEQKVPGKGIQVGSSIEFLAFYKELID